MPHLETALTESHGKLLNRYAEEIIIAYDSDEAGQKATERSVLILEKSKLKVKVLQLTDGLDPDDFIKKFGADKLRAKLANSLSFTDYQLKLLKIKHNLDYEDGRRGYVTNAIGSY